MSFWVQAEADLLSSDVMGSGCSCVLLQPLEALGVSVKGPNHGLAKKQCCHSHTTW